jgi:1-acyl-sn-glycerol-3-phosphate acyltransferase
MRSRNPITVTRTNPRQDLKSVLNEGLDRLQKKFSIIVFPQTTRSHTFDAMQMSSIGVKLAKKAGVSIIPLALKTDCWQNGKKFKDFGKLDVTKKAHYAFGKSIMVAGKGDEEHAVINAFIAEKLQEWKEQEE